MPEKPATPDGLDRSLWFLHHGCEGRHYLLGNPHTVPGRMLAWCPRHRRSFFVNLSEMERLSKAARYWIAGYLHGAEPDPPAGEDGPPDFDSPEYRIWEESTARFRETGA